MTSHHYAGAGSDPWAEESAIASFTVVLRAVRLFRVFRGRLVILPGAEVVAVVVRLPELLLRDERDLGLRGREGLAHLLRRELIVRLAGRAGRANEARVLDEHDKLGRGHHAVGELARLVALDARVRVLVEALVQRLVVVVEEREHFVVAERMLDHRADEPLLLAPPSQAC